MPTRQNGVGNRDKVYTTLNPIDKWGGQPWKETSYRNSVINLMKELGLIDVYRLKHRKIKAFTYESKPLKLKSRIDFFLTTQALQNVVDKAEIRISNAPDHKAIFLSITVQDAFKRGPGTWKFNNQLLEDEAYKNSIKRVYKKP